MKRHLLVLLIVGFQILAGFSEVRAAGFAILQQGTAAMAQGNAFVAQANDPSAIYFNPAGISQIKGTAAYLGATAVWPKAKYESPSGTKVTTESRTFVFPQVYLTHSICSGLTAGLGAFSPFGMGTKWPEDWPGRYLATSSDLKTYNLNPVLSWQVTPSLAVAAGADAMFVKAELEKHLNLGSYPDGVQTFSGSDYGYGYNLGLLYRIRPDLNFGLSYRSKIKVKVDGDAKFSVPQPASGSFPSGTAHTELMFPDSANAGIAYTGINPWSFEFDLTWTGWSVFEELRVNLDKPAGLPPTSVSVTPRNWNDVFAFRFGAGRALSTVPAILRAGYIYDKSPVPGETLDPSIPDSNRHVFCLGGDYHLGHMVLGLAYNLVYGEKREKNNSIMGGNNLVNGDYQQVSHSLALSLLYTF